MAAVKRHAGLARQAAILAVSGILVRVMGFAYRLPLTALIGDEGNGIYGASYNLYMLFLVVSSAGFPTAISKMVSERVAKRQYHNAHEVFRTCLFLVGGLGLAASLVLFFGAGFFVWLTNTEEMGTYYSIVALAPTVFIVALMAVFRGYFQGLSVTTPTAISQLVEQVFNAVFSVVLAMFFLQTTGGDLAWGAAGGTAGKGVGAVFGLGTLLFLYFVCAPSIHKRVKKSESLPRENRKDIAKEALYTAFPIIIGVAVFSITSIIDTAMVTGILAGIGWDSEQVSEAFGQLTGKYLPITTLPVAVATAIASATIPSIAGSLSVGDIGEANYKINKAVRITMMLCIPAAVGIGVLADQILLLLFPSFPEGGMLLRIGSVSIIFLALAQITTGMLQGCGHMRIPMYAALVGAGVKVILNSILIPIPGINVLGAVISTIVCYMVASGIDLFMLMRIMGRGARIDLKGLFLKPILASVVMGFVCFSVYYLFYFSLVGVFGVLLANAVACIIAVVLGALSYLIYMVMINGIDEEDLAVFPMGIRINALVEELGLRPKPRKLPRPPHPWELPAKPVSLAQRLRRGLAKRRYPARPRNRR